MLWLTTVWEKFHHYLKIKLAVILQEANNGERISTRSKEIVGSRLGV